MSTYGIIVAPVVWLCSFCAVAIAFEGSREATSQSKTLIRSERMEPPVSSEQVDFGHPILPKKDNSPSRSTNYARCEDNHLGENFCTEWCNKIWGCGVASYADTNKQAYTCNCQNCNGCTWDEAHVLHEREARSTSGTPHSAHRRKANSTLQNGADRSKAKPAEQSKPKQGKISARRGPPEVQAPKSPKIDSPKIGKVPEHELHEPKISKVKFGLVSQCIFLGMMGCDRCFMGQVLLGAVKGFPFYIDYLYSGVAWIYAKLTPPETPAASASPGSDAASRFDNIQWLKVFLVSCFTLWVLVDYGVVLMNMLSQSASINSFGFAATFGDPVQIEDAFWLAIVFMSISSVVIIGHVYKLWADVRGSLGYTDDT